MNLVEYGYRLSGGIPSLHKLFFSDKAKLGNYIIKMRMKYNMSQGELAMHAGVRVDSIYKIEGGTEVHKKTLERVLDVFREL